MSDMVRTAMKRAALSFGGSDGMFNGSGFGRALAELADIHELIDGRLVAAILTGRDDVETREGGSHYWMKPDVEASPLPPTPDVASRRWRWDHCMEVIKLIGSIEQVLRECNMADAQRVSQAALSEAYRQLGDLRDSLYKDVVEDED